MKGVQAGQGSVYVILNNTCCAWCVFRAGVESPALKDLTVMRRQTHNEVMLAQWESWGHETGASYKHRESRMVSQRRCFEGSAIIPTDHGMEGTASQAKGSACAKAQRHTGFHKGSETWCWKAGLGWGSQAHLCCLDFILTGLGSLRMVRRRLTMHFSTTGNTTDKHWAWKLDHLDLSSATYSLGDPEQLPQPLKISVFSWEK